MNPRLPIPADIVNYVAYDPETGAFNWTRSVGKVKAGERCGCKKASNPGFPYWVIRFRRHGYPAHRVAWLIMTGTQPPDLIDHKDGVTTNNRWNNLRAATAQQNGANRKQQGAHAKGAHCFRGRWQAHIRRGGRKVHLGCFDTEQEAHAAYLAAAREIFGEFARAA